MSEEAIKDALNRLPYGFYSITSRDGDDVNAMVGNWLTQASFTPRLLAFGLQKKAYSHGLIKTGGAFAVNIFLKDDEEALTRFSKGRAKNPDKMKGAKYTLSPITQTPILDEAAAYIECRVRELVDVGGDHDILVGEVVGAGILKAGESSDTLTLLDVGWSYAG